MEETMDAAVKIISKWEHYETSSETPNTSSLFGNHSRDEVLEFMAAVKDLQASLEFLTSSGITSPSMSTRKMVHTQHLLRVAKKRLSREFFTLLKANKSRLYSNKEPGTNTPTPSDDAVDATPSDDATITTEQAATVMEDLKLIADCMMGAGYTRKCLTVYRLARKSYIDDALLKLGVRRLKKSQVVKMDWDKVEEKMTHWLNALVISVVQIYHGEKDLCNHLFSSNVLPITDTIFSEVCKDSAMTLFRVPGKLAKHSKKMPDKIYKYLELQEAITDIWPEIEKIFSSESTSPVRTEAKSSITRITEAVRSTLTEFEGTIQRDASRNLVPGGGVHPLTRHVMDYFSKLIGHTTALDAILKDFPPSLQSPLPESYFEDGTSASPLALHFAWLIIVLIGKLETKAELYKDTSLSDLFLANNVRYIVKTVKGSKLISVLEEKWVKKHSAKVEQYAANYERNGWGRVLAELPSDLTVEIPLPEVKECFKRFNFEFEEEYRKQVDWVVHDPKLRDKMKASIRKTIDARYGMIYEKYKVLLAKNRERGHIDPVIKFTPEDLDNYLDDLLDGPEVVDDVVVSSAGPEVITAEGVTTVPTVTETGHGVQRRRKRLLLLLRPREN